MGGREGERERRGNIFMQGRVIICVFEWWTTPFSKRLPATPHIAYIAKGALNWIWARRRKAGKYERPR